MKTLTWDELIDLKEALTDLIAYESDNSCGDPDCCGEPYCTQQDADNAKAVMAKYGLKWNGDTE